MRIKFYLLSTVVALLAVGCVDSSFDLSDIDSDNIVIGSDESTYILPVATMTIARDDFDSFIADSSNEGTKTSTASDDASTELTFTETLDLVNAFLPTGEEVDIERLTSEDESISSAYTEELTDLLVSELQVNEEKREEFAQILVTNQESLSDSEGDDIYTTLGIDLSDESNFEEDGTLKLDLVIEALDTTLEDTEKSEELSSTISSTMNNNVVKELQNNKDTKIDYDIESVDLPSDLIDVLTGSGSVYILASYDHDFPFTFDLEDLSLTNQTMISRGYSEQEATVTFPVTSVDEAQSAQEIDLEQFAQILREGVGAQVLSNITLKTYTSSSDTGSALTINIVIRKEGGLTL